MEARPRRRRGIALKKFKVAATDILILTDRGEPCESAIFRTQIGPEKSLLRLNILKPSKTACFRLFLALAEQQLTWDRRKTLLEDVNFLNDGAETNEIVT